MSFISAALNTEPVVKEAELKEKRWIAEKVEDEESLREF
jgi:hypothetical protein